MGNIPNTNTPNLVLQSVGNGSNDSRWGTSGGGSGITQLTGDVTAGPGSGSQAATVVAIQGKTVSTTAPTDAQILIWNNSTSQWVPKTLSQDVTITNAGVATVAQLQGNTLSVSGAVPTGAILTYSGITNSWVGQATGATVGQVPTWNGSAWAATTPSSGGTTNNAWAVTNAGPGASVTTTPSTPSGWTLGSGTVTGFSKYLITVTGTIRTTANTTVSVGLLINSGNAGWTDAGVTVPANASGIATTVVCTNVVTAYGPSSALTVTGTVYTSASTGTFYNGNISVVGIA
jgi:hypothetical protein